MLVDDMVNKTGTQPAFQAKLNRRPENIVFNLVNWVRNVTSLHSWSN